MTYRDEEGAAAARIERLETELAEVAVGPELEEAERVVAATVALKARVGELRAELRELSLAKGDGPQMPKVASAGTVLCGLTAFSALLLFADERAVLVFVPVGLVGVFLVTLGLFQTWRAAYNVASHMRARRAQDTAE